MIAAIEWIPAGRANPNPSKYEYSRAEQEFLEKVQAGELAVDKGDDEEWEDVEENDDDGQHNDKEQDKQVEVPAVDPDSLPADLRMDDYSDEEDGEDKVGGLLVGKVCLFLLNVCNEIVYFLYNVYVCL